MSLDCENVNRAYFPDKRNAATTTKKIADPTNVIATMASDVAILYPITEYQSPAMRLIIASFQNKYRKLYAKVQWKYCNQTYVNGVVRTALTSPISR